jgi:hypothetical protein
VYWKALRATGRATEDDTNREAGRKSRDILICCHSWKKEKGSIVVVRNAIDSSSEIKFRASFVGMEQLVGFTLVPILG